MKKPNQYPFLKYTFDSHDEFEALRATQIPPNIEEKMYEYANDKILDRYKSSLVLKDHKDFRRDEFT